MSRWVKLDSKVLKQIRKDQSELEEDKGVTVEHSASPYDLPNEVRVAYDQGRKRFVIEFKYIQDEPWTLQEGDEYVDLRIGKNSKRVYGFEIDAGSFKSDDDAFRVQARQHVNRALQDFVHGRSRAENKLSNYRAVESILQRKPELFMPLDYSLAN